MSESKSNAKDFEAEFNQKKDEIIRLKADGNLEEARNKRDALTGKLNTMQQEAMRDRKISDIREIMKYISTLNNEVPRQSLEQPEQEDQRDKCILLDGGEEEVATFLSDEADGIIVKIGETTKICMLRSHIKPSVVRNALVKTCDQPNEAEQRGYWGYKYSEKTYINLRKMGMGFTDAIVDLREFLGYFLGNTNVQQFEIVKQPDSQTLTISYGLVLREKMDEEQGKKSYPYFPRYLMDSTSSKLATVDSRLEQEIYFIEPEEQEKRGTEEAVNERKIVPKEIADLASITSAVSAAHCQPGQEKTIWKVSEIDGFDYIAKYEEIIQSEEWKNLFIIEYDKNVLDALNSLLDNMGSQYLRAAIEAQQDDEPLHDPPTASPVQTDTELEDEVADTQALIKCAIGKYFKPKEDEEGDEEVFKNKLKEIFGGSWIIANTSNEVQREEQFGLLQSTSMMSPLRVKEITVQSIRDGPGPEIVKQANIEMVSNRPDDFFKDVIVQIQEDMKAGFDENDMEQSMSSFNRIMTDLEDLNCSTDESHAFARRLAFDIGDTDTDTEISRINTDTDADSVHGDSYRFTPPPRHDDDDQYESLIYCAYGKWYGENGTFEQLARQEATGDGQEEPTNNEITQKKMVDIFSEEWLAYYKGEISQLADTSEPPFLNEQTLISITESYIRDSTENESKKTELVTGLTEYSNMQEDPVKEILEKIQDELYDRINENVSESQGVSFQEETDRLLDICKTEIDDFAAELVRNNCNSSLFQVDSFSQMAEAVANNQVNTRRGNMDLIDPLLTPISSINSYNENDSLDQPMSLDRIADQQLDRFVNSSPINFRIPTPEGGKRRRKKKRKTKRKKNKKKKKKKTRRVKFNLKKNEYYTITPKNRVKKSKRKQTRKKRK